MDPVTVSIVLATIGWLVSATISKNVGEAWEQYTKSVGLHIETKDLIAELMKIKLLVEAAELMQLPRDKVNLLQCLKDVKELACEAWYLLDELDYFRLQKQVKLMNCSDHKVTTTPIMCSIASKFRNLSSSHQFSSSKSVYTKTKLKLDKKGMSSRIKALIKELYQRYYVLDALKFEQLQAIVKTAEPLTNKPVTLNRNQSTSYSLETNIYGRDKERDQILELILDSRSCVQSLPIVAIVGNGGVGKTTLAQLVYNHPIIKTYFDLRMWICVSTNLDDMGITRQMLECFSDDKIYDKCLNLNNLKKSLENSLEEKTVFVVLDDIWEIKNRSEWNSLLAPLNITTGIGNAVLVTTRDLSIAKMVSTVAPIQLDGLDESSFWSLFKNCVFGNDQHEVPDPLENIGREIAERLKGFPLAAKTVGALLRENTDASYWMEILESEKWKYQEGDEGIIPALRLSYEYLPIHLQRCFPYCSLFPKDYYFKAEELVYIWMAQGFIYVTGNDNRRIEDVGIEYLDTLVWRAFFQTIGMEGSSLRYVIHDLMHDLAQVVSKEEFLTIYHTQPIAALPSLHHLSIVYGKDQCVANSVEFKNLISLILIQREKYNLCSDLKWDQANKLRLLIMPYSLSHNLTNFIHLRYLSFQNDGSNINFPVEICRFYHLEVLDVLHCPNMELPREFNNLINLRHFVAHEHLHCKIVGVGKLKLLQELKAFEVHKEENGFELEQLGGLKELRGSLEILNLENVKCKDEGKNAKLSEKEVDTLKLSWSKKRPNANHASPEDILEVLQPINKKLRNLCIKNYGGCKSPSWLTNHLVKYLEDINLSHCEAWKELPNFGQLMCLKELHLSYLLKVRTIDQQFHGSSSQRGFPSLKLMEVTDMAELETWVWSEQCEVFPSLESLTIKTCPKLRELSFSNPAFHDDRIKWFLKLSYLQITDCPQLEQIPPIPCSRSMSQAHIERVGSIELINYSLKLEREYVEIRALETTKLHVPRTLDQVFIFKNFRNIKSMHIMKYPYLITSLSWKGICLLDCLNDLWIKECPKLLLSLEDDENDGKNIYSQKSLQRLIIRDCGVTGEGLSWLLAHLPAIRKLIIVNCPNITSVRVPSSIDEPNSSMSQISSLGTGGKHGEGLQQNPGSLMSVEELELSDCPNMFFVNKEGLSRLTALKRITIHGCGELLSSMCLEEQTDSTGWLPRNIEDLELQDVPDKMAWSLADLTSLHNLTIRESPKLTALDLYPFVALRKLVLHNCDKLSLVKGPVSLDCRSRSSYCKELLLIVSRCPILVSTWSSASRELDQNFLSSVAELDTDDIGIISPCSGKFLKALRSFRIMSDKEVVEWTMEQEKALLLLTALERLDLGALKNLRSLPVELYRYPSLKELSISRCPEIKSLPQKGFPKSLQKLRLSIFCNEELKRQCSQLEDFEYEDTRNQYVFVKKGSSVN